jgi:hypothetical protein
MAASKRRDLTNLLAGQTDRHGTGLLAWHRPGKRVKVWSRTLRRAG